MIKRKSYKFRFYPTAQQVQQLNVEFGNARFVWNHALDMRKKAYERRKESLNYVPLSKHITALKKTSRFEWLKKSTANVLVQKLIDLDTAYKNFFDKKSQFPRFKKKTHSQSIRHALDQREIKCNYLAGEFLKIPKLGKLDIKWSKIPQGIPKMATISKTASGEYYVSFSCDVEIDVLPKSTKSVGIDVGIKDVVVTSDGFYSGAPKFTYKHQRELAHAQRDLSRKTKGSKRWHKQRIHVAKIHETIANCRKDFLHKLTTKIVHEYDYISVEDLNVSGMLKNRCLSKAISDVGIFELNRQLKYKADWYGKEITVISRWFPSTKMCSACGKIHKMKLSDRMMNCDCGLSLNRDENAAINIKQAGLVCRGASNQPVNAIKKSA
jgi:putative transposase